jgi:hypothetical protein
MRAHIPSMSTYTIVPVPDGTGFNIGIAGANGARQTILGFTSEAEAEAWITQDQRLNAAASPFLSSGGTTKRGW